MERSLRFAGPALTALAVGVLLLGACSDDSSSKGAPPTSAAVADATTTTYGGDTAGTVTVSTSAITGQSGKVLLIFVTGTTDGSQAGVACVTIDADPFTMPPTMLTEVPAGGNPCAGGGAVAVLADGSYTLTAGVYVGGSQQPDAQMSIDVEMNGGAFTAELMGAELSAG